METLIKKAKLVLGIDKITDKKLKKTYRKKIFQYHPDKNKTPLAKEISSLIIESYNFLIGKINKPSLLKEDALISLVTGIPISTLEDLSKLPRDYEGWNITQFYDWINPN